MKTATVNNDELIDVFNDLLNIFESLWTIFFF